MAKPRFLLPALHLILDSLHRFHVFENQEMQTRIAALQDLSNKGKIEISDIQIRYAGKDSFYWQKMATDYQFENILENQGPISNEKSQVLQQQSCINLLLTISSPEMTGVLTGKMIEYFQAGSPVLGHCIRPK